jgi:hypothetical protein
MGVKARDIRICGRRAAKAIDRRRSRRGPATAGPRLTGAISTDGRRQGGEPYGPFTGHPLARRG